ncbi:MAG TPA: redoxin family protein [Pirellulaceae bacterium]|jgi:thiol-disulfide isomerase/thioredoxin
MSRQLLPITLIAVVFVCPLVASAAKPTAKEALSLKPVQKDVDYDILGAKEIEKCTVEAETVGGITGWVVRTGDGQILRRFLDTNGDNKVDQWCYFKDGIEAYRDIDVNFNNKSDQYRWMGTAGTRWGLDEDENNSIDSWKVISAEEVTAEVVAALRDRDATRFGRLLLTQDELKSLGLSTQQTAELKDKIEAAKKAFSEVARQQRIVTANSEWVHFGANKPGIVPAGTEGSTKDIVVYDNVTAIVETPVGEQTKLTSSNAAKAAPPKNGQLAIGTLIKVGETWKTFDLPKNLTGEQTAVAGYFFQPPTIARPDQELPPQAGAVTPEMKRLVEDLEQLDKKMAAAKPAEQDRLNGSKADLLEKIIAVAPAKDHDLWIRQYTETLAAAIQSGAFPNGIDRLQILLNKVANRDANDELIPYIKFKIITAEYNRDMAQPNANFEKINTAYNEQLLKFVSAFPRNDDAAEAMLQLAINSEFAGKTDEAVGYFTKIATDFPKSDIAPQAIGAKRRLESVGKSIPLTGKTLDGRSFDLAAAKNKVVLIHYWASWADPCKPDMAVIKAMQAKYDKQGFFPVGVNVDTNAKDAMELIRQEKISWPQLYEQGGLTGPLAANLGIVTLPTMMLVGKDGRVINRSITAGELDAELKKLLK